MCLYNNAVCSHKNKNLLLLRRQYDELSKPLPTKIDSVNKTHLNCFLTPIRK